MDGMGISGNVSLDMSVSNIVGISKYDELSDKPKINGVEVSGSKSLDDYGIASKANLDKNTENIDSLNRTKSRNRFCLYIGNSYTDGVGATDGNGGFWQRTSYMFDESKSFTGSGIGFGTYSDHAETFNDMVNMASADTSFSNSRVTNIILTSAMGDTRSICENGANAWESDFHDCINNTKNMFPNATIWVHYAETVYGRNVQSAYSNDYNTVQYYTHYLFSQICKKLPCAYLGWTGWNTNQISGNNCTDNYHLNNEGYKSIVSSFYNSLYGQSPYITRQYVYNVDGQASGSNNKIDVLCSSPFDTQITISNLTKDIFGESITAGQTINLLTLQDDEEIKPFQLNMDRLQIPMRANANTIVWPIILVSHNAQEATSYLQINFPSYSYSTSDWSQFIFAPLQLSSRKHPYPLS